jgi:signal peptidase I
MRRRSRVAAVLVGALAVARARTAWFPVRVAGTSMTPTLQPNDLLAVRPLHAGEPRIGQLVVIRSADREIVKRVVIPRDGLLGADEYWVEGDNAGASTDSRTEGPVRRDAITGIVRARYKPLRSIRLF